MSHNKDLLTYLLTYLLNIHPSTHKLACKTECTHDILLLNFRLISIIVAIVGEILPKRDVDQIF